MDSVTQLALGAVVGEAVAGRRLGRKAALWGAVLGTLPDLDVLIRYADPVADFTRHRSFTHSLLLMALCTPLLARLLGGWHGSWPAERRSWLLLVFFCLTTHALLDACTVYGTQLLWPLDSTPRGLGNLFIIDPLVTLPLLTGAGCALATRKRWASRVNLAALTLVLGYVAWSFLARELALQRARQALEPDGLAAAPMHALAAPFNTLLWRVVVMEEGGYRVGWTSLLDQNRTIRFHRYPSAQVLQEPLASSASLQRLRWFTGGFYALREQQGQVIFTDLRMGIEGAYAFEFIIGTHRDGAWLPARPRQLERSFDGLTLQPLWNRMFGDQVMPWPPVDSAPLHAPEEPGELAPGD